jgi:hypothetical protein
LGKVLMLKYMKESKSHFLIFFSISKLQLLSSDSFYNWIFL